jgi:hypothetical protein
MMRMTRASKASRLEIFIEVSSPFPESVYEVFGKKRRYSF